jgi:CBS domain-containing protein
MASPPLIVDSTSRFLRAHLPFSQMARKDLEFIAERARLAYFPVGTVIVDPAGGVARFLHVIQRGHVRMRNSAATAEDEVRGPGECFPVAALSAGTAGTRSFQATEDVFCYQLARADFEELRLRSAPFAEFCTQALATLVQRSLGQLRQQFSQRAAEQQTLLEPLRSILRRPPVWCEAGTPVRTALESMSQERVGTIAVVDADRRPVGIFTLTDLMDRVVLPGRDLGLPVADVMTPRPGALDELAPAQEALAVMAQQGYHQIMVTREGRLMGVVSERDLFALQRITMRNVLQSIRLARDVTGLQRVNRDIDALADNLVAQGAAAEPLTHTIAALNDALTQRLFALLVPDFGLDGVDWCWLSLGSEGRREQTVATDQDNAVAFDAPADEVPSIRARLLAFARAANEALAGLGFPLCRGNIMAGNPECCLTVQEWRSRFGAWIREPTPEALLAANIYFDFRPLYGSAALAGSLRHWLDDVTPANLLFLRMLVANALQAEPPLGWIRSFKTDEGEHAGTLDLKTHGTRIFVDAGRAFALAFGIGETNTSQRLRLAGRRLNLGELEITATTDAYHFLQMLRLRAQRGEFLPEGRPDGADATAGRPPAPNRVDPDALNELDRRMLKEAFRRARVLQEQLQQTVGR